MESLTIKKGETASQSRAIGHLNLSTVFTPATKTEQFFEIVGSADGTNYGSIVGVPKIKTEQNITIVPFDYDLFVGIPYIKITSNVPVTEDTVFNIFVKN